MLGGAQCNKHPIEAWCNFYFHVLVVAIEVCSARPRASQPKLAVYRLPSAHAKRHSKVILQAACRTLAENISCGT